MLTGTFQITAGLQFLFVGFCPKSAFIREILCFELFKILFDELVNRMLENKSLHAR